MEKKKKLSVSTGLCYAGGDVGCNIVFGMIGTLLTLFYTDYVGISAATVGLVMLLSRCFDGFSDLVMGVLYEEEYLSSFMYASIFSVVSTWESRISSSPVLFPSRSFTIYRMVS